VFTSATLIKVRTVYDNCSYILEMAQQFIPDKLPQGSISEFISVKKPIVPTDKPNKKEYQMFAPEFEHIKEMVTKGLKINLS
jgi:hypothetical protein